ncbi:hypothetical protein FRC07_006475, partial [Ceratobasidium sp. 392]
MLWAIAPSQHAQSAALSAPRLHPFSHLPLCCLHRRRGPRLYPPQHIYRAAHVWRPAPTRLLTHALTVMWVVHCASSHTPSVDQYGSASVTPTPIAALIPRKPTELRKQPAVNYTSANPYPSLLSTPPPSQSKPTLPASSNCQTSPSANPVKALTKDIAPRANLT